MIEQIALDLEGADCTILVVDDDKDVRVYFQRVVKALGADIKLSTVESLAGARAVLDKSESMVLAFIDKCLPDGDGVEFCRELVGREGFAAYVITGSGSSADCFAALEFGVAGYLPKPFDVQTIRDVIRRHVLVNESDRQIGEPMGKKAVSIQSEYQIQGESSAIIEVAVAVQRVSKTDVTVLISGASGTGKEVVAKQIHQLSTRRDKKFVAVNCGAIPETLIESELFGYEKGAFTDAKAQRIGLFEEANGGTIFLDEINSMPVDIQVKLLRVLQERKLRRIGKNQEIDLDVRVIAASNRSLGGEVEAKTFREDLYFRLKGAEIYLPPLVERSRDVMPLAKYFAERVARRLSQVVYFSSGVVSVLEQYSWPGNVRELESAIEYAVARCNGTILVSDLPSDLRKFAGEGEERLPALISRIEDAVALPNLIDRYAADVLRLCAGNKTLAAAKLGVDRKWIMRLEERLTTGKRQGRTHSFLGRSERAKAATSKAAS